MLQSKLFQIFNRSSRSNIIKAGVAVLVSTILFGVVTTCNGIENKPAKMINTDSSIGLASSIASIEFDKKSGKLISLLCADGGGELVDRTSNAGNLFRINYGVKRIADKPIGGDHIDAGEFTLKDYRFTKKKNKFALKLIATATKDGKSFETQLDVVTTQSGAFDLTLSVINKSNKNETIMVNFPYISGIELSGDPTTDLSIHMIFAGYSGAPAWKDMSNRYIEGHIEGGPNFEKRWTYQFDIIYNSQNTKTLGYMILDKKFGSKWFEREENQAMKVLHIPGHELEKNQAHKYPTARLMAVDGSWKVVAREYGNWFRDNFKTPIQPQWYQETNDSGGLYAPDWAAHIGATGYETPSETRRSYFDNFVKNIFLSSEKTTVELVAWHNWGPDAAIDPYSCRPDLGGDKKMRKALDQAHSIGRHVNSYFGGSTGLFDLVETGKPQSYFDLVLKDGGHFQAYPFEELHPRFGFRQATICPGLESWRKWVAKAARRVIEHGYDGLRLDEQPFVLDCFNPEHHHENPYDAPYRVAELMRIVREEVNKVKPDAIIMSEWGTDSQVPYINASLLLCSTNHAVTPARVAFPEFYWMPHHGIGTFECALNGFMIGDDRVSSNTELMDHLPNLPQWQKNENNRKRFEDVPYEEGESPVTKWKRLRSQFLDALVKGSTSDIDPYCPQDQFWRGTLFKSDHYYLLVGGFPNGTDLPNPLKIKIDYLPEDIKTAYEFNAYTLEKTPAKIFRSGKDIFVIVTSGFSAVLLPRPTCPPKIEATVSEGEIALSMFAPWRKDLDSANIKASIEIPGFKIKGPSKVTLPAVVEYKKTPAIIDPGKYFFIIRGDETLPYRGWFDVK